MDKVTHPAPETFDPERITEQTAPYFRAERSPLSQMHPDLAKAEAEFLTYAGWTPADLALFGGDPVFRSEVELAMATLEASRP